jgi:hypothetical protein
MPKMDFVDKAVDQAAKGPLDRMADLRAQQVQLQRQIANGQSGDGLKKPDLKAILRGVQGELRNLEKYNPGK